MFCSTCGVAVAPGLSYCNYCGAALSGAKDESLSKRAEVKPDLLVRTMATLFVFGLFVITLLMGMMKTVIRLDTGQVLGFTALCFVVLLLIEGVFIYLLLGRKRGEKEVALNKLPQERPTNELDAAQTRGLPEPAASVTEQTTRTLAPVSTERN